MGDFPYFLVTSSMSALSFVCGGVSHSVFGCFCQELSDTGKILVCGSVIEGCSSVGLLMPASNCAESMIILYIFPVSLSSRIACTNSVTC
mgnify:CR=1 FL=1